MAAGETLRSPTSTFLDGGSPISARTSTSTAHHPRPGTPSSAQHRFKHKPTLLNKLRSIGHDVKTKLHLPSHHHHPPPTLRRPSAESASELGAGSPIIRRPSYNRSAASRSIGEDSSRGRGGSTSSRARAPPAPPPSGQRAAIKIRFVSWNMHDELPTGDLTDLLGNVRACKLRAFSSSTSNGNLSVPPLCSLEADTDDGASLVADRTNDSIITVPVSASLPLLDISTPGHPYHLVVVAGQECPTASGVLAGRAPRRWDGKGWTTILEKWLCGGSETEGAGETDDEDAGLQDDQVAESLDEEGVLVVSEAAEERGDAEAASIKSKGTRAATPSVKEAAKRRRGPYVLVEKERLMGIYLAVFVLRNCEDFVRGTSKSKVTAGLLRGRLGNKGGVGISLSFAGSRLLFISAHLAAHASGLEIRKANIKKIFEELEIDDFSNDAGPEGPPEGDNDAAPGLKKRKELTERFDQTFFLGDLNMRLNITRLHADFLLKSPAGYLTALEFDQLREVLAEPKSVLKGFKEGPITFAPTYKYDVLRPKRKRSAGGLVHRATKRISASAKNPLSPNGASPAILEPPNASLFANLDETSDSFGFQMTSSPHRQRDSDALSIASSRSSLSSTGSGYDDRSAAMSLSSLPEATALAVRRAQVKFRTLVRSNSAAVTENRHPSRGGAKGIFHSPSTGSTASAPSRTARGDAPGTSTITETRPILRSTQSEAVVPIGPSLMATVATADEVDAKNDATFDTSSKQRVQSYTDRILFRSTVGFGRSDSAEPPCHDGLITTIKNHLPFVQKDDEPPPTRPSASLSHSYFDARPALDVNKIRDRTAQPWSDVASVAGDPRHSRFANFFGRGHRRGLASRSVDSLSEGALKDASKPGKRPRSLYTPARKHSYAPSLGSPDGPTVEQAPTMGSRRVSAINYPSPTDSEKALPFSQLSQTPIPYPLVVDTSSISIPALGSFTPTTSTPSSTPTTPIANNPVSFAFPTSSPSSLRNSPSTKRKGRSRQATWDQPAPERPSILPTTRDFLSDPSSPTRRTSVSVPPAEQPHSQSQRAPNTSSSFFRTNTLSRTFTRASVAPTINLNRFKSFLHSLPIPFLHSASADALDPNASVEPKLPKVEKTGPRKGEVLVVEYDAVTDLKKMGASSDHRPIYLVAAVGIGEEDVEEASAHS